MTSAKTLYDLATLITNPELFHLIDGYFNLIAILDECEYDGRGVTIYVRTEEEKTFQERCIELLYNQKMKEGIENLWLPYVKIDLNLSKEV
jgi:hypothetical protein|tara:strand:+ start:290 stop:562 length:273 start_codon:yes stop_codon:yes gene_type:complete